MHSTSGLCAAPLVKIAHWKSYSIYFLDMYLVCRMELVFPVKNCFFQYFFYAQSLAEKEGRKVIFKVFLAISVEMWQQEYSNLIFP